MTEAPPPIPADALDPLQRQRIAECLREPNASFGPELQAAIAKALATDSSSRRRAESDLQSAKRLWRLICLRCDALRVLLEHYDDLGLPPSDKAAELLRGAPEEDHFDGAWAAEFIETLSTLLATENALVRLMLPHVVRIARKPWATDTSLEALIRVGLVAVGDAAWGCRGLTAMDFEAEVLDPLLEVMLARVQQGLAENRASPSTRSSPRGLPRPNAERLARIQEIEERALVKIRGVFPDRPRAMAGGAPHHGRGGPMADKPTVSLLRGHSTAEVCRSGNRRRDIRAALIHFADRVEWGNDPPLERLRRYLPTLYLDIVKLRSTALLHEAQILPKLEASLFWWARLSQVPIRHRQESSPLEIAARWFRPLEPEREDTREVQPDNDFILEEPPPFTERQRMAELELLRALIPFVVYRAIVHAYPKESLSNLVLTGLRAALEATAIQLGGQQRCLEAAVLERIERAIKDCEVRASAGLWWGEVPRMVEARLAALQRRVRGDA